jgi:2-keto-4-pentenoate hydratase/2-oxohepta-3-ene-1,7-dioic acid hydratase in catechol pathway
MSLPWKRLIRFIATDGRTLRGEPILPTPDTDLGFITEADQLQARVIEGTDIYDTTGVTRVTDEVVTVKTMLGPLAQADVPILRCVGLNYAKHSKTSLPLQPNPNINSSFLNSSTNTLPVKEAGRTPPPFPFIFFKPTTTIHDHNSPVTIPLIAQDSQADYEGELCLILGRDAKNVSIENALSYIAAYTVGNDISSRKLQRDPALAGRVPQWGFSKGFDTFAPLGPCLVAGSEIKDPRELLLKTVVDGELRQEEGVSDLLFDCAYLVSYLSQGTTLQKGSVIMTGTPGGE